MFTRGSVMFRGTWLLFGMALSVPLLAFAARPPESNKPFIIGSLLGRTGNRMFEVATACAVAWDNDAEAYFPDFDPSSDEFRHIFFRCKTTPPPAPVEFVWPQPKGAGEYQPIPFQPNMQTNGFFQDERYFSRYRDRLLKLFRPHRKDLEYIRKKYKDILDDSKSVSVHLRYYYAEDPKIAQHDQEYFTKAMALFPKDSLFVVTSDNMAFARKNIPTDWGRVVFIENEPPYIDFFLQSLCKHNIISNSTFSWWSAWLNENSSKIVVRPRVWGGIDSDFSSPDGWIKIEARIMQEKGEIAFANKMNRESRLAIARLLMPRPADHPSD